MHVLVTNWKMTSSRYVGHIFLSSSEGFNPPCLGKVMQMHGKPVAVLGDIVVLYDLYYIQFLTSSAAPASKTSRLHSATARSQLRCSRCHCALTWGGKNKFIYSEGGYGM